MTREEVKNKMHDYMDGQLSVEERETVDSYLEEYVDVASEYELLSKLLHNAESLPIGIKPPDDLIKNISNELLSVSLEDIEKKKADKLREITERSDDKIKKSSKAKTYEKHKSGGGRKFSIPKGPLILLLVLLISAAGYFAYYFLVDNFPWRVTVKYGEFTLNGTYSAGTAIAAEDKITTFDSTKVIINIPNAGRVELNSFTSLKVVQGKDRENIVALDAGAIDVFCKADDPKLKIKSRLVDINTISGDYSVVLTNEESAVVETKNGTVQLKTNLEEVLLIQDHRCEILSNGEIGIPIHIEADGIMTELINAASFNKTDVINYDQILLNATQLDGFTLFHLLKETKNTGDRLSIFIKLNELYPLPPGVTQQGIMSLSEEMLKTWREEIEWQI